jgi:hypothetical protein
MVYADGLYMPFLEYQPTEKGATEDKFFTRHKGKNLERFRPMNFRIGTNCETKIDYPLAKLCIQYVGHASHIHAIIW